MGVKGDALIWGLRPTPPREFSKLVAIRGYGTFLLKARQRKSNSQIENHRGSLYFFSTGMMGRNFE